MSRCFSSGDTRAQCLRCRHGRSVSESGWLNICDKLPDEKILIAGEYEGNTMQHFVNEYEYTPDILQESIGAWWECKYKGRFRSMLAVFILIAALSIVMKRPAFLLTELAPLFVLALFRMKKKKAIQIEQERCDVLFRGSDLFYRVEVGEDISVTSSKGNSRIQFSDVENYIETRNLIVLLVKGSMTVALDKKGFREGTREAFVSLLANTVK